MYKLHYIQYYLFKLIPNKTATSGFLMTRKFFFYRGICYPFKPPTAINICRAKYIQALLKKKPINQQQKNNKIENNKSGREGTGKTSVTYLLGLSTHVDGIGSVHDVWRGGVAVDDVVHELTQHGHGLTVLSAWQKLLSLVVQDGQRHLENNLGTNKNLSI